MFRCYRQLESSDCGLTCIRMIARHYGKNIPMRHLKEKADLSRLGMSINDIVAVAERNGMDALAVRINPKSLSNMPLPAILYWQQQHFVVIYKYNASRKSFHIADPSQGKMAYNEIRTYNNLINLLGTVCVLCMLIDFDNFEAYTSTFCFTSAVTIANFFAIRHIPHSRAWYWSLLSLFILLFLLMLVF